MAMPINPGASNAVVGGSGTAVTATAAVVRPFFHNPFLFMTLSLPPRTQIRRPLYFYEYSLANKDDRSCRMPSC
jgi:hypothetical protein